MSKFMDDFFASVLQNQLYVKLPERGDDNLSAATTLLEKKRELQEVEQALMAQKEEYHMKMESLQQRREELQRKEFQLKESLIRFDKFVKENDGKRIRALKKAQDERDNKRQKEKELERLKSDCDRLAQYKDRLVGRIDRNQVHHRFIEKVVEISQDLHEIREVMARFDTLMITHDFLVETEAANQINVEAQKQELLKYTEQKRAEVLSYNNMLATLQSKLDEAEGRSENLETNWQYIRENAATKTLLIGKVKMATYNLYQQVYNMKYSKQKGKQKEEEMLTVDDTGGQLAAIESYIHDLSRVIMDTKKLLVDEAKQVQIVLPNQTQDLQDPPELFVSRTRVAKIQSSYTSFGFEDSPAKSRPLQQSPNQEAKNSYSNFPAARADAGKLKK